MALILHSYFIAMIYMPIDKEIYSLATAIIETYGDEPLGKPPTQAQVRSQFR